MRKNSALAGFLYNSLLHKKGTNESCL